MINTNDMNQDQVNEAMDAVADLDDIDPASTIDTLMTIADYHDLDLLAVLDTLLSGATYGFGPETLIQDIIFQSQSNPDRAMLSMRWMMTLVNRLAEF